MTTIFLSGSRKLTSLNETICSRLDNIIDKGFSVLVGDANGADKAIQTYLHSKAYSFVTVYCSGGICRNNIGQWEQVHVEVDKSLQGRAFYTIKDKEMASKADYGLILWDGKSQGSLNNATELISQKKPVVIWLQPEKKFVSLRSDAELQDLTRSFGANTLKLKESYQQVPLAL